MQVDKILTASLGDSIVETKEFYASSFEFMRYIVDRFGKNAPWLVINKVSSGESFKTAFTDVTGYNCRDLYLEWVKVFELTGIRRSLNLMFSTTGYDQPPFIVPIG